MRMETIKVKGRDGLKILKELIRRGNATKIIVKNGDHSLSSKKWLDILINELKLII